MFYGNADKEDEKKPNKFRQKRNALKRKIYTNPK